MVEVLRLIGTVLIHSCTVASVAFVVLYQLWADWRRERMGPHVMAFMGSLAAVFALSSIRLVFGDSTWFVALRTVVFVAVPAVLYWRLWLLIKTQLEKRRARLGGRE